MKRIPAVELCKTNKWDHGTELIASSWRSPYVVVDVADNWVDLRRKTGGNRVAFKRLPADTTKVLCRPGWTLLTEQLELGVLTYRYASGGFIWYRDNAWAWQVGLNSPSGPVGSPEEAANQVEIEIRKAKA